MKFGVKKEVARQLGGGVLPETIETSATASAATVATWRTERICLTFLMGPYKTECSQTMGISSGSLLV